ncbi:MAG: hypothetical protein AAB499_01735, partial [Patescibacteria group bacterium]
MYSNVLKVVVGFVVGAVIGSGATLALIGTDSSNDSQGRLSGSGSLLGQDYQQQQQQYQQPPPDGQYQQPPPDGQYQLPPPPPAYQPPIQDPNQYQQPAANQQQYQQQPPPTGNDPNAQQYQQQPGQHEQPYSALRALGPPPEVNFQGPAGLQPGGPDNCFREKGGEALVSAMRSGKMTPAQAMQAGTCFSGSFNSNAGPGANQGPGGSGGPGGSQNYGQMQIFSGDFTKTMSSVRPPAAKCVEEVAGGAVADGMFGQGVQPDNATREKIFAAGCFGGHGPGPGGPNSGPGGPGGPPGRPYGAPPPEVAECLKSIGNHSEIQSGNRMPTAAEFGQGRACFAKAGINTFFVPPHEVPANSPLALCAIAASGVTDISTITPNSLTFDQRNRMRRCYNPSGDLAYVEPKPALSETVANCVKAALGETIFAQVSTGQV